MRQHQTNQHKSSLSPSQRNVLARALAGLLFCADGFVHAGIINKGVPVRIMAVGDSITEGKYTQGGYRKPLYQMLKDNGYTVTFVGKEDNGNLPTTLDSLRGWRIQIMRDMGVPASVCS